METEIDIEKIAEITKKGKQLLKKFDAAFAEQREKLCPEKLEGSDRAEWLKGFNESRCYAFRSPQSKYYDLGFTVGTDFRNDFFS
jgi:hypothetical protein